KTKVIPRMQRTYFGGSAAIDNSPRSGLFKYLEIESYEDTLNNLQLTRNQSQQNLLDSLPLSAKDEYLLQYMLHIESRGSLLSVAGWLPTGELTLVLWRDVEQVDYETLNRLCETLAINPADSEYGVVYINGDHNIPAVFTSTEAEGGITKTLKLRQIEPEFLSRMFAVEGV